MERGYSNKERAAVSTSVEKLDNCLGGKGLRLGRVHEIINTGSTDAKDASSLGFVVALLVRILNVTNYNKRVLWCSGKKKVLNSQLSATGLYWLGFDPNQLIQANVLSEMDQYWVMEECLKCSELLLLGLCRWFAIQGERFDDSFQRIFFIFQRFQSWFDNFFYKF